MISALFMKIVFMIITAVIVAGLKWELCEIMTVFVLDLLGVRLAAQDLFSPFLKFHLFQEFQKSRQ